MTHALRAPLRSLLFTPALDERKLARAFTAGADAVIVDLEDSVSPAQKPTARSVAEEALATNRSPTLRLLRVNGADTEFFEEDCELARRVKVDAVVLPKATLAAVDALGADPPAVIALVETSAGLVGAAEIGACPSVVALALGAVDLGAELGLEPRGDELELLYARSKLVVDSAVADLRPPIDSPHLDFRDLEALERSARLVRSLGFRGKLCIHPQQIEVVNRVFTPSDEEIQAAERVIEAYDLAREEGRGVLELDGQMIDAPVVARAYRTLRERPEASD